MRLERHCQGAANRTQIARQCELAGELVAGQCGRGQLSGCSENAQGDRQIESAGLLRQVCRRKIDRDLARRKFELRVLQRRAHPVTAFPDFGVGQSDQIERGQPSREVHFDRDRRRIESGKRAAMQDGNRHKPTAEFDREESGGGSASALLGARPRLACFQLGDPRFERLELLPRA